MKNVLRISALLLLLISSHLSSSQLLRAQSKWERIGEEGFNGVAYISSTKVIAVANEGRILTSMDAGKTWTRQTIPSQTDLVGISFFGTDRGIIIGFQQGEIFVTTNGGTTWQPPTKSINDICNQVDFVSNDTAFIIGSQGRIYRSIDGGKSWNVLTTGITSNLNRMQFADTRNGFAVGDSGVILHTTDGQTGLWK